MNQEKGTKNAEISARIAEIVEYLGETPNSFAKKLGYDRTQTIYDILNQKSAPSFDFFRRFTIAGYSEMIDFDWVFTGKGEMLKTIQEPVQLQQGSETLKEVKGEAAAFYKMYKEKDEENKELLKENARLEERLRLIEPDKSDFIQIAEDASTGSNLLHDSHRATSAGAPLKE